MNIYPCADQCLPFLRFIASKKREFDDWRYLHVYTQNKDATLPIEEMIQFLGFNFQKSSPHILTIAASGEMLVVVNKSAILALNKFEKGISEHFSNGNIASVVRSFDAAGLEKFSGIIAPHLPKDDAKARTLFARMGRLGNRIMILDDDMMVNRQLEKLLENFGYVQSMQDTKEFFRAYTELGPDVLFLDIHLRTARGNEILRELIKEYDPDAHVIMISSDTASDTVVDIKTGGAKGFIAKPFNKNSLYQHMMRVPTLVLRSSGSSSARRG